MQEGELCGLQGVARIFFPLLQLREGLWSSPWRPPPAPSSVEGINLTPYSSWLPAMESQLLSGFLCAATRVGSS